MSRPAEVVAPTPELSEPMQEVSSSPELVRRVVFECNATGAELASGVIINLKNSRNVFKPTLSSDSTCEEKAAFEKNDFSKGIITGMTLKSVSSSCPETVTVGMNLFENEPNVVNAKGWLYSKEVNEMSDNHAHENEGFLNVATILPHERQRPNEVIYEPANVMDNQYIQKYGGYTMEKLRDGIVNFSGKDYAYVPEDHVVVSIVRNNWESLGINLDNETAREGEYMKISSKVVDDCIKQLYENVITQIPYTKFSDLGARFAANTEGSSTYKVVCEMLVKYRFP